MTAKEAANAAAKAKSCIAFMSEENRSALLCGMALSLRRAQSEILAANAEDIKNAKGLTAAFIERLTLDEKRVEDMARGMESVADMPAVVNICEQKQVRPNGLEICRMRVPFGVVAVIYESRPNVTSDAAALALKSGNAVILRGGSEAARTSIAVTEALRDAAAEAGISRDIVQYLDCPREEAAKLMTLRADIDLLIPRGGAKLIADVVNNSTVPVIETGSGNCHIYVDASAALDMACDIVYNAKTSRPSVCNAAETLLVHEAVAKEFLPLIKARFSERVELRCCERARAIIGGATAGEEDYETEYLDYIMAVRVVSSLDEALAHIARYGTKHSECIVTESDENAERFLREVDAAAVYRNASTRFTDGGEFGVGAEIGISTQKLHARGPMGAAALTSYKYTVRGTGQIRS